jgi:hypothetical protein
MELIDAPLAPGTASTTPRSAWSRPSRTDLRRLPDLLVGIGVVLIIFWRWSLVTAFPGPIGVDSGNWLRLGQAMLGHIDIQDVVAPPLVPALAWLMDIAVGPLTTSRLLPVAASVAPTLGLWWVLRDVRRDVLAALAALAIAVVTPTAAAFAWGGVPQLLGLGLLPIALWTVAQAAVSPSRRAWLLAGTTAALVGLTSTLVTVLLASGVTALLSVALLRTGRAALSGVFAASAPLLPVAGLYVIILSRMSLPEGRTTAATGMRALQHGLGEPHATWLALLALVAFTLLSTVNRRETTPAMLLMVALAAVAVAGLQLGDVRFIAGVPSAIAAGTVLVRPTERSAAALRVASVGGLLLLVPIGVATQATQLGFYAQFAPAQILDDIDRIAELVPEDATVAVPPVAGAPAGWWLEARGINAAVASRSDWLSFPGERAAAEDVLRAFSADRWPHEGAAAATCAAGAPWLYVPDAWGGMDTAALARELTAGRLHLVERLPGGLLLRSGACAR